MSVASGSLTGLTVMVASYAASIGLDALEAQTGIPRRDLAEILVPVAGVGAGLARGTYLWVRGRGAPPDVKAAGVQALETLDSPEYREELRKVIRERLLARARARMEQLKIPGGAS